MLRALVHPLAVLHLGPGIAFAMLAFGCDGIQTLLGSVCGASPMKFFAVVTFISWLALRTASVAFVRRQSARSASAT
jgi:hypothetical protein